MEYTAENKTLNDFFYEFESGFKYQKDQLFSLEYLNTVKQCFLLISKECSDAIIDRDLVTKTDDKGNIILSVMELLYLELRKAWGQEMSCFPNYLSYYGFISQDTTKFPFTVIFYTIEDGINYIRV